MPPHYPPLLTLLKYVAAKFPHAPLFIPHPASSRPLPTYIPKYCIISMSLHIFPSVIHLPFPNFTAFLYISFILRYPTFILDLKPSHFSAFPLYNPTSLFYVSSSSSSDDIVLLHLTFLMVPQNNPLEPSSLLSVPHQPVKAMNLHLEFLGLLSINPSSLLSVHFHPIDVLCLPSSL